MRVVTTLLALSIAATAAAQGNTVAPNEKEISRLMHEYFEANSKNPDEFVSASERLLHEKYQFGTSNGQRLSRAEAIARIKGRPTGTAALSEESISVVGNTGVASYKMSIRQVDGGGADFRASRFGSRRQCLEAARTHSHHACQMTRPAFAVRPMRLLRLRISEPFDHPDFLYEVKFWTRALSGGEHFQ